MQQVIDKIKTFIMKYKRYLGAVVLFVLFVLILTQCTGPNSGEGTTQQMGTEIIQQGGLTTQETPAVEGELEKNANEELMALMQEYYTAYAGNDLETLELIVDPLTENEKSYIEVFSAYYEAYQNIECYSLEVAEDSYFVSVCYDLKFYEADTPAPGLDFFYVQRNGKGNLYVNNVYSTYNFNFMEQELDANIYAQIKAYNEMESVSELQQSVQARYDEAVSGDEKLANLIGGTLRNAMTQWMDSITAAQGTESTEQSTEAAPTEETQVAETESEETNSEAEQEEQTAEDEKEEEDAPFTVKTKDICNVRAEASADAELLGRVTNGVKLTAVGTEGDWTKVEFQDGIGYIRSDLLKKVKS